MSGELAEKLCNDNIRDALRTLKPTGNIKEYQKEYLTKKLMLCAAVVGLGIILSAALWIKERSQTDVVDNKLYRNAYGDGAKQVELVAENDGEEIALSLEIEEKQYNAKELDALLQEFIPALEEAVLGNNQGLDMVLQDLRFIDSIEGFPFLVEWSTDGEYIDYAGHLLCENLKQPAIVELTALISCDLYEVEHRMSCYVYPGKADSDTGTILLNELRQAEAGSRENEFMTLPSEIGGTGLSWRFKKSHTGLLVLLVAPLIAMLLYYSFDRDLYRQVEDRKQELRLDYPDIVGSLALLIGAGMTPTNAWAKLVKDYVTKKENTGKSRCAYEEMLFTAREIQNGISQPAAYERFGLRCQLTNYNKLAALMAHSVTKGSSNLADLLREEAADVFEERKHIARELGEKASTKLLMPMMLLLGMIMVIMVLPAFTNYL